MLFVLLQVERLCDYDEHFWADWLGSQAICLTVMSGLLLLLIAGIPVLAERLRGRPSGYWLTAMTTAGLPVWLLLRFAWGAWQRFHDDPEPQDGLVRPF